jgi:hypothetical protein
MNTKDALKEFYAACIAEEKPRWFLERSGLCSNLVSYCNANDIPSVPRLELIALQNDLLQNTAFPFGSVDGYAQEKRNNTIWKNPKRLAFIRTQLQEP